ncbi:MAG: type I secretion system permease/ATPase [Pseudomonadota bacterium]
MRLVAWFAARYGMAFSPAAVLSRLPGGTDLGTTDGLGQALSAVSLKSQSVETRLNRLDPAVCPFIASGRSGQFFVVIGFGPRRRTAQIYDPGLDETREVTWRELQRMRAGPLLLVTPEDESRRHAAAGPEARAPGSARQWFWGPVRQTWPIWIQVILASLLINLLALALPLFVMTVYDRVIPTLSFVSLWTLAGGVCIAIGLDLLLRLVRTSMLEAINRRVDMQVAARLFRQALDIRMLDRTGGAAGLASRIREYEAVREFFASSSFVSFIDLIFVGIFVAVLFAIVGVLAWIPVAAIGLVLVLALLAQMPISRSAATAVNVAAERNIVLVESLSGIESLKTLNAEPVMQREWQNAVAASTRINGRTRFWSNVTTSTTIMVQQLVSVGTIFWGVFLIANGSITIGGLIAANILAGRALAPLSMIAQTVFRAQYARKSIQALDGVMSTPTERAGAVRSHLQVSMGALALSNVSFTYPGANVPAVRDVSLEIAASERVALLGRVGSGKSTLGKMIVGLLPSDSGTILVDHFGITHFDPAELREGVGYLPQSPQFFTGTLKDNLLIGQPDAAQADIEMALHVSGLADFVSKLPEGLDHFIGEQGRSLSGGQAQALALARLIIRKPRLLFLDEPTNAMDQEMEANVAARLRSDFDPTATLILCTHRNTLAEVAERFIILDAGRKVMDGPRETVIQRLSKGRLATASVGE